MLSIGLIAGAGSQAIERRARARTVYVGPSPLLVAEIAKADALLRAGCYTCLQDALAIYQRNKVAQGAFDAALLLAVRDRELGIPSDESFARARALALPASRAVLDASDLVIGETSGFDPEQL